MASNYRPQRVRNIFDPSSNQVYKISRSKLDLFIKCPRCFYLDRRLGVSQPPGYPFTLNNAVDALLKKEFDYYRQRQEPHPLITKNNIDAIPYQHAQLEEWRDSLRRGIQFHILQTSILLTGGVDDVWIDVKTQELIIVDYKATSKAEQVSINADWQKGYKRQTEIYQWLFRKNGFPVSKVAYFVYCNGRTNGDRFDEQLLFDISLISYIGSTEWIEPVIYKAYECLCSNELPPHNQSCDYCQYILAVEDAIIRATTK